jgi:hypothetical protein
MSAASVAGMRVNQNGSSNPIHFPFSNPLKTSCSCRSRGNEAHFHSGNSMSSEPPYVGCYFLGWIQFRKNFAQSFESRSGNAGIFRSAQRFQKKTFHFQRLAALVID